MKVLTLTQPWATLVALGAKMIETRSFYVGYRGPLLIHAAKGFPLDCRELCNLMPFSGVLVPHGYDANNLPLGVILCETELVDCLKADTVANAMPSYSECEHEADFGDYSSGRFAWLLRCRIVRTFDPPIPAKGALGLWSFDIEAALRGPAELAFGAAGNEKRETGNAL